MAKRQKKQRGAKNYDLLTHAEVRELFAGSLLQLANDFNVECKRWQEAVESGEYGDEHLLMNTLGLKGALFKLNRLLADLRIKVDALGAGQHYLRREHRERLEKQRQNQD